MAAEEDRFGVARRKAFLAEQKKMANAARDELLDSIFRNAPGFIETNSGLPFDHVLLNFEVCRQVAVQLLAGRTCFSRGRRMKLEALPGYALIDHDEQYVEMRKVLWLADGAGARVWERVRDRLNGPAQQLEHE